MSRDTSTGKGMGATSPSVSRPIGEVSPETEAAERWPSGEPKLPGQVCHIDTGFQRQEDGLWWQVEGPTRKGKRGWKHEEVLGLFRRHTAWREGKGTRHDGACEGGRATLPSLPIQRDTQGAKR